MTLDADGFEILDGVLPGEFVEQLRARVSALPIEARRGGIRRIDRLLPDVASLARSARIADLARSRLSGDARLVRAVYFDKSPRSNWLVTWHQDRTVAVSGRFDADGWGPWSMKAGAWHVQPPVAVLERMVTVRLHLDAATAANGGLKVLPGSHRLGLVAGADVRAHVEAAQSVQCDVPAGGAMLMRPLLLHASEKASVPAARRVLHFEYSDFRLPDGISWAA